jgi:NADH-quinone oxidoreductase subunit L
MRIVGEVLPDGGLHGAEHDQLLAMITALVPVLGIVTGWLIFGSGQIKLDGFLQRPLARSLRAFWFSGWGFDDLYERLLVRPFVQLAEANKSDAVDLIYRGLVLAASGLNRLLLQTQTGGLRWYATSMAIGLAFTLLFVLGVL